MKYQIMSLTVFIRLSRFECVCIEWVVAIKKIWPIFFDVLDTDKYSNAQALFMKTYLAQCGKRFVIGTASSKHILYEKTM